MRVIPFSAEALEESLSVIRSGGVIAHATETCYGFACDLRDKEAVEKLFSIKDRPRPQPVSALFASVDDARKWVLWNDQAEELAAKHLPGPLTLILPLRPDVALFSTPNGGTTIGIRVSSHAHAMALAKNAGFPLSTTSANIHGRPNTYSAQDIAAQFLEREAQPDLILDGGILPQNPPSTIINLTKDSIQTMRKGNIRM